MRKEKAENGGKKAKMGEKKPKMGKNKPRKGGKKEKAPKAMENNGCEQWQRWESPGGAEVAPPPPPSSGSESTNPIMGSPEILCLYPKTWPCVPLSDAGISGFNPGLSVGGGGGGGETAPRRARRALNT